MNILLAVIILTFSYIQGIYVPKYQKEPAVVGPVAANSIARRAGLETGDLIVSVHNNPVKTWEDLEITLGTAPKDALNVEVLRNNRVLRLHFDSPSAEQVVPEVLGFRYPLPKTIVSAVDDTKPAKKAGVKAGDEIISVEGNGKIATDYNQIMNMISESKGVPLNFEIRRSESGLPSDSFGEASVSQNSKILHLTITPIEEEGRGIVGFYPYHPTDLEKFGLVGAVRQSVRKSYEITALTFKIIGRIVKGSASIRTLSGPIEIAKYSASAARTRSARVFFGFLAMVSLQLGVFNLLPIPILDGGVIALLLIEGVLRRDLSLGLKEKIVQVGFVFLILLMGFVVFNDLSKIIDFNRLFR
jgi:regulator of sigma E protease